MAIENLFDNAIKFSYHGTSKAPREIRLRLIHKEGFAELSISNYGIGVPEEQLEGIRVRGVRANIPDPKAETQWGEQRRGTGLGLPLAIKILSSHGGSLDINSWSAPTYREDPEGEHHRYVTEVKISLPLKEKLHVS
jgi:signal transduction histidine kinase